MAELIRTEFGRLWPATGVKRRHGTAPDTDGNREMRRLYFYSEKLAEIRYKRGWKSRQIAAKEIGCSEKALGNYERGERPPPLEFLADFARATGADLSELVSLRLRVAGYEDVADQLGEAPGLYTAGVTDMTRLRRRLMVSVMPPEWSMFLIEMVASGRMTSGAA